jgi:superfamily II DNA or RNA helicase
MNKEKDNIQRNAEKILEKNQFKGTVALATGCGKSKIFINICKRFPNKKWLLVVPTEELRDENWKEEFSKWGELQLYENIKKCCYASLKKEDISQYDGICFDESHNVTVNNTSNLDLAKKDCFMISLTATPPHEEDKLLIFKKYFPILYKITLEEAVNLKLISPFNIKVIELNLDNTDRYIEEKYGKVTEVKKYEIINRRINQIMFSGKQVPEYLYLQRMHFLYNLKSKEKIAKKLIEKFGNDERILYFCSSIKQAESLCDNVYHSKSTNSDLIAFKNGQINKLAVVRAINEGHNIENVDKALIVQLVSNPRETIQRIGRTVRLRDDHQATIYILCVLNTQDEKWVEKTLLHFDKDIIEFINSKNI